MRALKFLLFVYLFFRAESFCHKQTGGFTIYRVQPTRINPAFDVASPDWNFPVQRFIYKDSGKQCFVFFSEDGKYVLKLFKRAHLLPSALAKVPLVNLLKPFHPQKAKREQHKQWRDFMGYKVAFEHFREDTGLLALHLNPTPAGLPTITIVDKIGVEHALDLNITSFALQRKALSFSEWLAQSDDETIHAGINAIFELFHKRIACGIRDDDPSPYKNFGFFEGRPIQIDPGQYEQASSSQPERELAAMRKRFIKWLRTTQPQLIPYVEAPTAAR